MYVRTFVALLVLLWATVAAAFLPIGHWSIYVAMTIACTKALLILSLFMHLRDEAGLIRLFAGAGFAWLVLLLVFAMADYATRKDVLPRSAEQEIARLSAFDRPSGSVNPELTAC